jgi:hypothetical protein
MDQIPDLFGTGLKRRNIEGIVVVHGNGYDFRITLFFAVNQIAYTGLQQKNTRDDG